MDNINMVFAIARTALLNGSVYDPWAFAFDYEKAQNVARKKAGGIFYTPQPIVKYMVAETIGRFLLNKTPAEVSLLAFCDPACGSGVFLIGTYEYLLAWHSEYYHRPLTIEERKSILKNNIYGVDIDNQAVQASCISLLLTCFSKQGEAVEQTDFDLMSANIFCGNSLIHTDFSWQIAFPKIFERGGFEVVIRNPPYLSVKTLNENEKTYYEKHYRTAEGQYDLYSLFCELSVSISNKKGLNSLIVPDSILARSSFKMLRQFFHDTVNLEKIVQIDEVFTEAAVSSCIYFARKQKSENQSILYLKAQNAAAWDKGDVQTKTITYLKDELINSYRLLFMDVREFSAVRKFYGHTPLASCTKAWRGEEIGKKADTISTENGEEKVSILTGEDIKRYALTQKSYIKTSDIKKDLKLYKMPKILIRQLGNHISATYSKVFAVSIQSVYNLYSIDPEIDTRYILAILNSRYIDFIYSIMYAEKMRFPRILLENIRSMTIPTASLTQQAPIIALVEHIIAQKAADAAADTTALEREIDTLVYALYDLTAEEIAVVEA